MANIYARSPHIVKVSSLTQLGSKIELYIYDGSSGGPPVSPQYTLSKLIPASNNTDTYYNISPYLREYLEQDWSLNYNTVNDLTTYSRWTWVEYKTYNLTGAGYVLDQTKVFRVFDGYGYYEDGVNPDLGSILLGNGTKHYYWYDHANTPSSIVSHRAGMVTALLERDWFVYRQNLVNPALTQTHTYTTGGIYDLFRVNPTWYADGNIMQIYDDLNVLQWEATFIPKVECRYTPMTIDFINRYGGWQREFFFKASQELFNVTNTTYNLMMDEILPYTLADGQRAVFNANGIRKYTINTGWVDESYGETIQELLLSERIIWNDSNQALPVKINTKNINKQKNINNKTINYQLEIELAFDVINSVI
jgi:hypothetical protein